MARETRVLQKYLLAVFEIPSILQRASCQENSHSESANSFEGNADLFVLKNKYCKLPILPIIMPFEDRSCATLLGSNPSIISDLGGDELSSFLSKVTLLKDMIFFFKLIINYPIYNLL